MKRDGLEKLDGKLSSCKSHRTAHYFTVMNMDKQGESSSQTLEPERKKKQLPKVAYYVAGAAVCSPDPSRRAKAILICKGYFATVCLLLHVLIPDQLGLTVGMTLAILPYVRQAQRAANAPQFLNNRNYTKPLRMARSPKPVDLDPVTETQGDHIAVGSSRAQQPLALESSTLQSAEKPMLAANTPIVNSRMEEMYAPELIRSLQFNSAEEDLLYGTAPEEGDDRGEPLSPLFGVQALGIATAIVFTTAGVGILTIANLLDVWSVSLFSSNTFPTTD
jgi:hypothetical protein